LVPAQVHNYLFLIPASVNPGLGTSLLQIGGIRKGKVKMTTSKEDGALERSREKLKRDIEKRFMQAVDEVLDIAEVAIADPPRYKPFRSKVLRSANNAIRDLKRDLDLDYKVLFVPTKEDVIEVNSPPALSKLRHDVYGKGE
jgi:hypothetical protein